MVVLGFGLVIVEAMAAGLPVITTAHSMGPDVIAQGENGWLVPIRNADALAQSISSLRSLSNEAYAGVRNQARRAAGRFTWDQYALHLKELTDRL